MDPYEIEVILADLGYVIEPQRPGEALSRAVEDGVITGFEAMAVYQRVVHL